MPSSLMRVRSLASRVSYSDFGNWSDFTLGTVAAIFVYAPSLWHANPAYQDGPRGCLVVYRRARPRNCGLCCFSERAALCSPLILSHGPGLRPVLPLIVYDELARANGLLDQNAFAFDRFHRGTTVRQLVGEQPIGSNSLSLSEGGRIRRDQVAVKLPNDRIGVRLVDHEGQTAVVCSVRE